MVWRCRQKETQIVRNEPEQQRAAGLPLGTDAGHSAVLGVCASVMSKRGPGGMRIS